MGMNLIHESLIHNSMADPAESSQNIISNDIIGILALYNSVTQEWGREERHVHDQDSTKVIHCICNKNYFLLMIIGYKLYFWRCEWVDGLPPCHHRAPDSHLDTIKSIMNETSLYQCFCSEVPAVMDVTLVCKQSKILNMLSIKDIV